MFISSWQKGLAALAHRSAHDIQTGFVGNLFDFIDMPAENDDLEYVAVMMPYFATFFFDTPSNAEEFKDLIETYDSQLYVYSINDYSTNRNSQLVNVDSTSN